MCCNPRYRRKLIQPRSRIPGLYNCHETVEEDQEILKRSASLSFSPISSPNSWKNKPAGQFSANLCCHCQHCQQASNSCWAVLRCGGRKTNAQICDIPETGDTKIQHRANICVHRALDLVQLCKTQKISLNNRLVKSILSHIQSYQLLLWMEGKGRHHKEKHVFFWALPELGL